MSSLWLADVMQGSMHDTAWHGRYGAQKILLQGCMALAFLRRHPELPAGKTDQAELTAGGVERANSYGADGAPEYFQDWATRIEAMPSDRAAGMLEAMSEQDRLKVQRIIDEHSMEHARAKAASPRSTGPLSARSRRCPASPRLHCGRGFVPVLGAISA